MKAALSVCLAAVALSFGGEVAVGEAVEAKFALVLDDGTRLIGVPVGTGVLPLETEFGRAEIPLRLIAAVEALPDRPQVAVRLRNGDRITGRLRLTELRLETAYGRLAVPVETLSALTAHDQLHRQPPRARHVARAPGRTAGAIRPVGHFLRDAVGGVVRRARVLGVPVEGGVAVEVEVDELGEELRRRDMLPPAPPAEELEPLEHSAPPADVIRR